MQQSPMSGLGTHWNQAPVTLEDAHGFLVPIPLELVNSWGVSRLLALHYIASFYCQNILTYNHSDAGNNSCQKI